MHPETIIRTAPIEYGPERPIVLPNRRAQLKRERDLEHFLRNHRFVCASRFTRLRTPAELAKVAREHGHNFKPLEIEYAAARLLLAIGEPEKH